ncbi:MAG: phosphoribosylaminoimidazolesuccinocarboxamide synthase [Candidatus Stygibacter australis]|nr:phosphoribosylaminoimidazolesuccinocarboxamide synthase [Candidatus Stygibacter australis]MDP8321303.1 phosphoribosylaminoimidazolesuccinocarboxamide synthase [Candidatus Stygibacter australis]
MYVINKINSPQLKNIHSGKVRDSFRISDTERMLVVSDRISSFDSVLNSEIPYKGAVLNGISSWWFEQTEDIIGNHFIKMVDPNIALVKEAEPIRIEMIVRGYLTGSMWRRYKKGDRTFSGVNAADGLTQNQKFPNPILTPTTKEEHDREITPEDIVKEGWTTSELYNQMAEVSLKLFDRGTELLASKGIILVDTKYEFGLLDGKLILIDEIHTPDSSRFWSLESYKKDSAKIDQMDKEYVRQWLLNNKKDGRIPEFLPPEVISETSRRYLSIYNIITGSNIVCDDTIDIEQRIAGNLVKKGIIKDAYVSIFMGSPSDLPHCENIIKALEKYDIFTQMRVVSAHKNGERIPEILGDYNNSIEPGVIIAVAGRSNGLGGALAANSSIPVISCPPFKDKIDMMVNINSTLIMPSKTPGLTVIDTGNAAKAAINCLNISRLRKIVNQEIADIKESLIKADNEIKER